MTHACPWQWLEGKSKKLNLGDSIRFVDVADGTPVPPNPMPYALDLKLLDVAGSTPVPASRTKL